MNGRPNKDEVLRVQQEVELAGLDASEITQRLLRKYKPAQDERKRFCHNIRTIRYRLAKDGHVFEPCESMPPVGFPDKKVEEFEPKDWLQASEQLAEMYAKTQPYQESAIVRVHHDPPIGLFVSGDWHLGHLQTDYAGFRQAYDSFMGIDKLFMLLMGDAIQNFVRHGTMHPVFQQSMPPHLQERLVVGMLEEMMARDKILAAIFASLHDLRSEALIGHAAIEHLLQKIALPMGRNRLFVRLQIGKGTIKQEVPILLVHQSRYYSFLNRLHSARREYDLDIPAHIVVTAHRHAPGHSIVSMNARLYKYTSELAAQCDWPVVLGGKIVFVQTGTFQDDDYGRSFWGAKAGGWPQIVVVGKNPMETDVVTSFDAARKMLN